MTRIDFYVLPEAAEAGPKPDGAVMTACKLCDKAATAGQRTYVYAPTPAHADALDAALWSFRQGSFIAHERLGAKLAAPLPSVLIGNAEPPAEYQGVMINLGVDVPPFFSRFERVLEIVDGDAAERARSRERYKFYRDRGYELAMHKL
ncbi:MAG: polymerase subunit chi [Nevskia sp.]|nr:polymerase subunit chi [Nevskia sp.]